MSAHNIITLTISDIVSPTKTNKCFRPAISPFLQKMAFYIVIDRVSSCKSIHFDMPFAMFLHHKENKNYLENDMELNVSADVRI